MDEFKIYDGPDCIDNFYKTLEEISIKINNYIQTNKKMTFNYDNQKIHKQAKECHICKQKFLPNE